MKGRKAHLPYRKADEKDQKSGRADYITVCHIKDREIDEAEVEEIHHKSSHRTVDQVSDRAGKKKDHGNIERQIPVPGRKLCHKNKDRDHNSRSNQEEKPLFSLKNSKGSAPVFRVQKLKDSL